MMWRVVSSICILLYLDKNILNLEGCIPGIILAKNDDGPIKWATEQPIFHSNIYKFPNFNGPFEIFKGPLQNFTGHKNP